MQPTSYRKMTINHPMPKIKDVHSHYSHLVRRASVHRKSEEVKTIPQKEKSWERFMRRYWKCCRKYGVIKTVG